MKVTIDRIEGDYAIVELPDTTTVPVPLGLFPDAKEGDVYQIAKDEDEIVEREQRIQDKYSKLRKK